MNLLENKMFKLIAFVLIFSMMLVAYNIGRRAGGKPDVKSNSSLLK